MQSTDKLITSEEGENAAVRSAPVRARLEEISELDIPALATFTNIALFSFFYFSLG